MEYKVPPLSVRYQGLFDFEGLYQIAVDWAKTHRYWFHEDTYKHKVPSPYGAEQEMWWWMEAKVTEFWKYHIDIKIHLWEMTEVEVVKDGKKKTLTNARIQVDIKAKVIADWQKKFKGTRFRDVLKRILTSYVWKKDLVSIYLNLLMYRTYNLHTLFKKYLDMQTAWNEYKGYLMESA